MANPRLSVLDLVIFSNGKSIADAYAATRELALRAEAWGYTRYWMAEHHNLEGIGSAATPLLIGYVASQTSKIRVGSGGIMLPNHSPLVVAEQFGTLETLYPGRIDLGLGRAPGTDRVTMQAIRGEMAGREPDFGELIDQLMFYFSEPRTHQKVKAIPGAGLKIPLYILGSSHYSAHLAARLGRPYAFAGHFAPGMMLESIEIYRREFRASATLEKPYVMIGTQIVAADTDARAEFLSTTILRRFLGIIRGTRGGDSSPVESMNGYWSPAEEAHVRSMLATFVVGGPDTVRESLKELVSLTGADEVIMTSDVFDFKDRLRSYEIVAKIVEASR